MLQHTLMPAVPLLNPEVKRITAAQTVPLRHKVLRPGRPVNSANFPGDEDPTTHHLGAFCGQDLLSIASLFMAEMPEQVGRKAFQLRGMATAPQARGRGLGRQLVAECIRLARAQNAELVWCNARTSAAEFYRKLGFETVGPEFDIPDVGPHFRMRLDLTS